MNTKQLIVLWYAGLTSSAVLFLYAADQRRLTIWPVLVGIGIIAALLIYSLQPHPAARKGLVAASVVGPPVVLVGGLLYLFVRSQTAHLPAGQLVKVPDELLDLSAQVELFDTELDLGSYPDHLRGRVRNKSPFELHYALIRIRLYEAARQVDGTEVRVDFKPPVPPGEAQSFQVNVSGLRPSSKWSAGFEVVKAM